MKSSLSAPSSGWMKSSTRTAFLMPPCSFSAEVCVWAQLGLMPFPSFNKEMEENLCFNVVEAHSHAATCPGPDLWVSPFLTRRRAAFICVTERWRGNTVSSSIFAERKGRLFKYLSKLFHSGAKLWTDQTKLEPVFVRLRPGMFQSPAKLCETQDVFHTHTLQLHVCSHFPPDTPCYS